LDGDGRAEALAIDPGFAVSGIDVPGHAYLMALDAAGTFGAPRELAIPHASGPILVADLDGDGLLDVLAVSEITLVSHLSRSGTVIWGDRAGAYELSAPFDLLTLLRPLTDVVTVGDVDGDGRADVLYSGVEDGAEATRFRGRVPADRLLLPTA